MTQSFIAPNIGNPSSLRKDFIQTKSVAALATARYLASAEDLTTIFYFFLFYITRLPPSLIH